MNLYEEITTSYFYKLNPRIVGLGKTAAAVIRSKGKENKNGMGERMSPKEMREAEDWGSIAEAAASDFFKLPWTSLTGPPKGPDIGTDIQIRYAKRPDGNLIIRPSDTKEHIYVLIRRCSIPDTLEFVGWCYGYEYTTDRCPPHWKNRGSFAKDPVWLILVRYLHPFPIQRHERV